MKRSIIPHGNEHRCWFCGSTNVERHHCIHGYGNRPIAEKYGLTVYLCRACHNAVHGTRPDIDPDGKMDEALKIQAQRAFEMRYGRERWMREVGKNYRWREDE